MNEAKYLRKGKDPYLFSTDKLKKHCKYRYPVRNHNGVYYIDVNVFGVDGTFHPFTFVLDTGWSDNAISKDVCSKINCRKTTRETTGLKRQKVTGGFIGLGMEVFRFDEFFLDDREWLDKMGLDGVIGSSVLFSKGLFLNLKNEYLCFPERDLKEVAENLNFLKVNAMFDAGRIWVDFYVNTQPVKDYFIDTGASLSSLLTDDIERLKLNHISQEEHYYAASGLITHFLIYFGALPPIGSNIETPPGLIFPPAAIPIPPCVIAPRSVIISPNMLPVTITSNHSGFFTIHIQVAST